MDSDKKFHRRYIHQWLLVLLLLGGTTIGFNYLVDPYGLFDTARIPGFNEKKPLAASHVRMVKPYQVMRFAPVTLIMGNSRPEMGLDPANRCWSAANRPVFNLSLPGSSIYMQARVIQHALSNNQVKQLFWGLDFVDFFKPHALNTSHWNPEHRKQPFEERLKVNMDGAVNSNYWLKSVEDHFKALFSLDALEHSMATLVAQNDSFASTIRRDGFNPAREYLKIIRWEGQRVLFEQKQKELKKIFSRDDLSLYVPGRDWSPEFEDVQRLLDYAAARNVRVTLFMNPYHLAYLTIIHSKGHWEAFEEWKRQLSRIAAQNGVTLWDFALINELTTEPFPPVAEKAAVMHWFWEPAHYRKEFGNLMMSQMLKQRCSSKAPFDVGIPLTPDALEIHLAQSRLKLKRHIQRSH
ncbi:MAG TPA: hypothetical protein EYP90_11105 [Chromatiaceae bacterium]|nr:hypothetical protein [Chromatiaceae bacterium]